MFTTADTRHNHWLPAREAYACSTNSDDSGAGLYDVVQSSQAEVDALIATTTELGNIEDWLAAAHPELL